MIREVQLSDAAQIANIYNYYVKNSTVTFEEKEVSITEFEKRISSIKANFPYLVFEEKGTIIGYAYASTFRTRVAYRFSAESSVYIHHKHYRKGIGSKLYHSLIPLMKQSGLKSAIGGITLPNDASINLHESLGFTKVGHFKEVGYKFSTWLDVGFWQLEL